MLITINELERLGTMKNIHEMALEYCFNTKNTGTGAYSFGKDLIGNLVKKNATLWYHF